ncbi:MAG: hypothetical protein OXU69_16250 [Gemmatimonadota bacterium]|nr:hypothetical protein [Gemmatimonadota bacterium]
MRTSLLRFAFGRILGVSRKTHEASRAEVLELRSIVEALKKAKLKLQDAYAAERRDLAACRTATRTLEEERDTLVEINRNLARELHRVNELFACRFDSTATRDRALRNREVNQGAPTRDRRAKTKQQKHTSDPADRNSTREETKR